MGLLDAKWQRHDGAVEPGKGTALPDPLADRKKSHTALKDRGRMRFAAQHHVGWESIKRTCTLKRRAGTPLADRRGLQKPAFGHAQRGAAGCDDVIDQSHIDEVEGGFQSLRDQLIGLGR